MPWSHLHVKLSRKYLVAVTGSTWLLRGLRGYYGVYVAVKASTWLLRGLRAINGVYVAFTSSMWLLQRMRGNY